jgi:hypothetical protein
MMELKVGDKVVITSKASMLCGRAGTIYSIYRYTCYIDFGDGSPIEFGINTFKKIDENTNKIKMVIGINKTVECGEYKVVWEYGIDYKSDNDFSNLHIYFGDSIEIITLKFIKLNYKQQLEIANLILDKLGINVELVEEDVNKEVLEQIEKLESELEKLREMIK